MKRKFVMAVDRVEEKKVAGGSGVSRRYTLRLNEPDADKGQDVKIAISGPEPFEGFAHGQAVTLNLVNPQTVFQLEAEKPAEKPTKKDDGLIKRK